MTVRKLNFNFRQILKTLGNQTPNIIVDLSKAGIAAVKLYVDEQIDALRTQLTNKMLKDLHPVGSTYITFGNENPEDLFGGTWQKVAQGRMLLGAGTDSFTDPSSPFTYNAGDENGEKYVTLSSGQIPKHAHTVNGGGVSNGITGGEHYHREAAATLMWVGSGGNVSTPAGTSVHSNGNGFNYYTERDKHYNDRRDTLLDGHIHSLPGHTHSVSEVGNDEAHNNMPPYIAVNIWKRTAL